MPLPTLAPEKLKALQDGLVFPAHPLAVTKDRRLDERRQVALSRYYLDAGAGGLAVAVHTTQFGIRDKSVGLLAPVLELAADVVRSHSPSTLLIAGAVGKTDDALHDAELAADLGYDCIMPQLGAFKDASNEEALAHCARLAEVLPIFGFYLQPAVGGRPLGTNFWRGLAAIENVVAIKIAPFSRYETLSVMRGVAESGRADQIALYTGNDDHIILDLLTPFPRPSARPLRIVGGLLGHWAIWTNAAVAQFRTVRAVVESGQPIPVELLDVANRVTDANAAVFDVANNFRGSIAGIHEILRRQGLLAGRWCLDPNEDLSNGQLEEIDRVCSAYPELADDEFVSANLDRWLS
jgi:hypothetical protein